MVINQGEIYWVDLDEPSGSEPGYRHPQVVVPTSVTPTRATISLGLAERKSFAQTIQEIIHNALTALYHSKLNGRNKSSGYTNAAYINFFGEQQKVEPLQQGQPDNEAQKQPIAETENNYPAAQSKYIKATAVAVTRPVSTSARTEKNQKRCARIQPAVFNRLVFILQDWLCWP